MKRYKKMTNDDDSIDIIPGIQYHSKIHVDYLSHDWKNENVWISWKVMTKQKKIFDNGIRLENASWRVWAKQKYNLKTLNPKELNWLKDDDITWLYGPAWSNNIETLSNLQYNEDKSNYISSSKKSCLKKKPMLEILCPMIKRLEKKNRENDSTFEPILLSTENNDDTNNRKIQFNDYVEQYIATDNENNSSEDEISKNCSTICKLAPTKLKEDRIYHEYSLLRSKNSKNSKNSNNSSKSKNSNNSSNSNNSNDTTWSYFQFFFYIIIISITLII
ncbi:unnamed protein product [Rhizophagus irregularis]|uniref:Nitrogen regulatory protein areA GATA-like domain-containing protein n=2 Tax=Rhizophagus irregularis TaxID=588596 RepID=A0A916E1V9_9GLOM|nr:unnamed protein product [Rhizophagus irregularis]CAB5100508.1 unnamed protein product [Rhizophagus irregularis]CAB5348750.1 unnamed protein product [Rhizophagus irregularis]